MGIEKQISGYGRGYRLFVCPSDFSKIYVADQQQDKEGLPLPTENRFVQDGIVYCTRRCYERIQEEEMQKGIRV
ncbi:MAG: hypothetical protein Q7R87_04495 [Nanoarchaeota archaeon]|nr:hypothetical protein [Nanoarchaeota archaeon]